MKLVEKIGQVLVVNTVLVMWCAGVLSLDSATTLAGNPDPAAILVVVISIAIAWHYIMETK